jgi:hypothetical protein
VYRSDEDVNTGVPLASAAAKIASASASEPARGLSMKQGFFAPITANACWRCGRPSLVSNSTASTLPISSSIDPTISTPSFCICSVYCGTRSTLDLMSGLPCG